jgi:hypothetical protein
MLPQHALDLGRKRRIACACRWSLGNWTAALNTTHRKGSGVFVVKVHPDGTPLPTKTPDPLGHARALVNRPDTDVGFGVLIPSHR